MADPGSLYDPAATQALALALLARVQALEDRRVEGAAKLRRKVWRSPR